jgi:chromosome partitioning protein
MSVIAVINHKGGSGKTTTAVNLAAGLALLGRRVLLIDLDPQGHAAYGFGLAGDAPGKTSIAEVMDPDPELRQPLTDAVVESGLEGLGIAASDVRLSRTAGNLPSAPFRETILAKALKGYQADYDAIIIDTIPSLQDLSINAIVAADKLLIPAPLSGHSLDGLSHLLKSINTYKDGSDFDWRILKTFVTGYGRKRQGEVIEMLEPVKDKILKTEIARSESIERSQITPTKSGLLQPVILGPRSKGRDDFKKLAAEIDKLWLKGRKKKA